MFPLVPFSIPWLWPFHDYAPLIWLSGLICLWLTRYTHQLAQRWGRRYYLLSAFIRPSGVLLTAMGWLAVMAEPMGRAPRTLLGWLQILGWHDGPTLLFWVGTLHCVGMGLSLAFGLWAVATLGLRRSFLYRRLDDSLITDGAYGIVRHPQFLSAIGVIFFAARIFPGEFYLGPELIMMNWVLFTAALWLLAVLEDRELATHFGEEYEEYAQRVPRLFPN
jgi:protein-S-isoprenylcysteine O-methyltransferase Ste14